MDLGSQAAGIGVLADDTRRALYEYVVAQPEPVGREQAAAAVDLPLHRASFHLDRLVAEGLLEVEFRRLTGRTGPAPAGPASSTAAPTASSRCRCRSGATTWWATSSPRP